jgi:hypothetical protein
MDGREGCRDYNLGEEFLRCCVGGVTLGISAPLALQHNLASLQNRLADFRSEGSLSLRLNIQIAGPSAKKYGNSKTKDLLQNSIIKLAQKAPLASKRKLFQETGSYLDVLLSDPVVEDWLKQVFLRGDNVTFIPLMSGFLLVTMNSREALLLLDKKWQAGSSDRYPSWWPLANITAVNAVMAFLAIYLAERGDGCVVHGTGLSCQGHGYLFLAPSGGGKTSLSMQSPPHAVLADDGIILRKSEQQYRIYPTPFRQRPGGETRQWAWHKSAKTLRALFILDKGDVTRLNPLCRAKALGSLINGFTHYYMWMKPQQTVKVFDFWRRLSTMIPIAGLKWRLGSDFWPEIHHFLKHENKNETKKRVPALAGGL